ncbi:hypothetical protein GCM10020219_000310 [Nonomuraea dietziae]
MTGDSDEEVRDWATTGLANLDADTPGIRGGPGRAADGHRICTPWPEAAAGSRCARTSGPGRASSGCWPESDDDYARATWPREAKDDAGLLTAQGRRVTSHAL